MEKLQANWLFQNDFNRVREEKVGKPVKSYKSSGFPAGAILKGWVQSQGGLRVERQEGRRSGGAAAQPDSSWL
jgi:hypothetical protein